MRAPSFYLFFPVLFLISFVVTSEATQRSYKEKGIWLNELKNADKDGYNRKCPNVAILYARDVDDRGNVGKKGYLWLDAVADRIGYENLAVQGVNTLYSTWNYPAKRKTKAANELYKRLRRTMVECPKTKFILFGTRWGAGIVLEAMLDGTSEDARRIAAGMHFRQTPAFMLTDFV